MLTIFYTNQLVTLVFDFEPCEVTLNQLFYYELRATLGFVAAFLNFAIKLKY